MADNYLKTPLGQSLNDWAYQKILNAVNSQGRALPCSVVAVEGSIVTVRFEVNAAPATLPRVKIPVAGAEYIRYPIQVGCLGVAFPASVRIGNVSGLSPGVPTMATPGNLAALKKEGNNDYKLAQIAYKKSDFEAMEKYLRGTLSDFNSSFIYPAGIQLMDLLQTMDRDDEILSVAGFLQKNFPVYPEAYIAEARVWEKKGKPDRSIETLDRGWMFAPENPNLIKWRRHFGVSG